MNTSNNTFTVTIMNAMNIFLRFWPAAVLASLVLILIGTVDVAMAGGKSSNQDKNERKRISRGRYLVSVAGCNDCHTPQFMQGNIDVPESEWLVGSSLGFAGPWGVSYPWNLRTMVQRMSETDWVNFVSTYQATPPMPYWSLHNMTKEDLGAIFAFIKHLGPKGEEAPPALPPGAAPATAYFDFSPKLPK